MSDEWYHLQNVLKQSIQKNGSIPLTTQHLLRIMNMVERRVEQDERRYELESCRFDAGNW